MGGRSVASQDKAIGRCWRGRKLGVLTVLTAFVFLGTLIVLGMWKLSSTNQSFRTNEEGERHLTAVTVTRVVSKFKDCMDGEQSLLPSESTPEAVLDIRDGFVLERGVVGEVGGVVFEVSGGCCLDSAESYSV